MPERIHLPLETREDLEAVIKKLDEGFERNDEIPYQPWGTEILRVAHLIKYTEEEKAEIEAEKERRNTRPRPSVDLNLVTVPIISAEDDKAGKENLYKEYCGVLGYHEVHRTSTVAVLKLDDPRGVMLSDEDIELILEDLGHNYEGLVGATEEVHEKIDKTFKLHHRLSEILKHSEAAKAYEPKETQ